MPEIGDCYRYPDGNFFIPIVRGQPFTIIAVNDTRVDIKFFCELPGAGNEETRLNLNRCMKIPRSKLFDIAFGATDE